jgi:hypothetical protein
MTDLAMDNWVQVAKRRDAAYYLSAIFEPIRPKSAWHGMGRCGGREQSDELFFPSSPNAPGVEYAKAICSGCPVARECLIDALSYPDTRGIRAGYHLPYDILDI